MKKEIGKFLEAKLETLETYCDNKGHFLSRLEVRSIRHFFQRIFFEPSVPFLPRSEQ